MREPSGDVPGLVEDLFRRAFSRLVSSLTGALGPSHLDLVEESVQDALVRALQTWPYRGVPDDPEAWLFAVARNRALDRLRRRARPVTEGGAPALERTMVPRGDTLHDDELALVIMCCHPSLTPDARVALTLRLAGGLSVEEIAAAFLLAPPSVYQRIVRAKRTLRREGARFEIPPPDRLAERLDSVLRVVYLLFREGYASRAGDAPVRVELCDEAIRLGRILAAHPATAGSATDALLALMLLQSSRLPARTDVEGDILVLEAQDRRLWDRQRIQEGLVHLDRAGRGEVVGAYHLEAGIAAVHAVAPSFEATDWPRIVSYYDGLMDVAPSPVVAVNRAVAVAMAVGPEAGLAELDRTARGDLLERYRLLPAVRGTLLARAGRSDEAGVQLRRALMAAPSEAARRLLEDRLAALSGSPPAS